MISSNYNIIYSSHPEEQTRIFLCGETHGNSPSRLLNSSLLEDYAIPGSVLVLEGALALEEIPSTERSTMNRIFKISERVSSHLTKYIGWDGVDTSSSTRIGANISIQNMIGNHLHRMYQNLHASFDLHTANFQVALLDLPDKSSVDQLQSIFSEYDSFFSYVESTATWFDDSIAPIFPELQEHCSGHTTPYLMPFPKNIVEEMRLTKQKLVECRDPEEALRYKALFLHQVEGHRDQIKVILDILTEFSNSFAEEIDGLFPHRTQAMCDTLIKLHSLCKSGEILGNIFLIAGGRHLHNDDTDSRFSLTSLYETIRTFEMPVVILEGVNKF